MRYAPQFANFCAMALTRGELDEANPEYWLVSDGKLYIFGKPMGPELFQRDLAGNLNKAEQNRHSFRKISGHLSAAARAESAGCPVLMVTVDRVGGRNQETLFRLRRSDTRECSACHDRSSFAKRALRRHNYDGIDLSSITGSGESSNLSWDTIKRMRDITRMKIVLKGIITPEDAELAVQKGIDGILVSNHGGRGEDNGRSTIDALPEIIAAVNGRMPVIVDGGFRRGTDVIKALAMGAQAVGVGRPYLWGLGAFGQEGVERVLDLLRTETHAAMQQCGVRLMKELNPSFVRRAT